MENGTCMKPATAHPFQEFARLLMPALTSWYIHVRGTRLVASDACHQFSRRVALQDNGLGGAVNGYDEVSSSWMRGWGGGGGES